MATTFATVTDWMLEGLYPEREVGGRVISEGTAESGYEWVRDIYTVVLYRIGQGCSSYAPLVGTTAAGNTIQWSSGGDTIAARARHTYTCKDNPLHPEVQAAGIWRESIVWQWKSKWYQASESDAASPVPPS